jgi:hypothetical protein
MATPNPVLEAAIVHFAQQPGVSPAQVSELRAALASDPALTKSLEQSAASGALHGFAPAAPGAPDRPVGDYDPSSGTVTLPASSFTVSGATPTKDLHAVLRVQSMVVDFGGKSFADQAGAMHPVTPDMLTNLQDTLNGSPALADELKRAATTADPQHPQHRILETFAFTAPDAGVGGSFNAPKHTMNLTSASLATASPGAGVPGYRPNDLTFVIGHEIQHGFNAQAAAQARTAYTNDARALAVTPGHLHDYTTLVKRYVQSGREDEAKAEIAGWNALRSRVEHDKGSVTLLDLQQADAPRVNDFIETTNGRLAPRANVQLNPDLSMSPTPANVAAMGHNYFDRPTPAHLQPGDTRQPMNLGTGQLSDYTNYYAGWAIATIGVEEHNAVHAHGIKPVVEINMAHAGLYEDMMEKAGLNLNPSKRSIPYLDSSTKPAVPHRFDHTVDGPHQYQYVPVVPSDAAPLAPARLDDPGHADHGLFQQARGHVVSLDQSLGRAPDQHTDQIASALTVQARADGLHRIDQIALSTDGNRLWAVQTPPGRTDRLFDLRTSVPTAEATTPMEHSAAKWPEAMQQFQQTQQEQTMSRQVAQDQAQAPAMTPAGPMR